MGHDRSEGQAAEGGPVTRAVEIALDPSPSQERWLRSYVGSIHAFRTGLDNAALALKNFSESRAGKRRGRKVGFPRFKNRHSRQAVTFVELADHVDHSYWIRPDTRTHVRLMLRQRADDGTWERRHTRPKSQQARGRDRKSEVQWLHTHQPDAVRSVWDLCDTGRAKVQALTIKFEGGRWKAVFRLRLLDGRTRLRNPGEPVRHHGGAVGVDLGLRHLVTLDRPVPGLTDERGHVPNPRVLDKHLARNIRAAGERLMREHDVASIRGETRNGEPRPGETEPAQHHCAGGHRSSEAATDPAAAPVAA